MAIGSATSFYTSGTFYKRSAQPTRLYSSGTLHRKSQTSGFYTPGSLYGRFEYSNAYKMNREAINASITAFASGVTSIYSASASFWEGMSEIAAEQRRSLIQDQLKAKIEEAEKSSGSILDLKA